MDSVDEYDDRRERSHSPIRRRSASPARRDEDERMPDRDRREPRPEATENPGTNLFVTGIAPRIDETELREIFSKYGQVDSVQIMTDPHTKESRGFGFVSMVTADEAEAAKSGLTGEDKYGRTMSVEKARRARPSTTFKLLKKRLLRMLGTPTPGKYFGPPKRDSGPRRSGPPPRRYDDRRYDDRSRGYGNDRYSSSRYDDRGSRYDDRPRYSDDRGYGRDRPSYGERERDPYDRPPPRDDYYSRR